MLKHFSNRDLAIVAICLDEEDRLNAKSSMKSSGKRKYWVHDAWKTRDKEGEFATLLPHLLDDETKFCHYFRMPMDTFNRLELKLQERLAMQDTYFRKTITPRHRLATFLRFLATGDSFKTISFTYRMGRSTVGSIVHRTSRVVIEVLLNEVMPAPTEDRWNEIAIEFWERWQFPNCIGALDGKHVTIQAPKASGSLYWNYKKTYSIVLLALVDARYNFIFVDVGSYGRNSDGGVLANSNLGRKLSRNQLNIPDKKGLPGTNMELPMVIVADEAFPLTKNIMRPFPGKNLSNEQRIFNYRLSRARRMSENVFGIMVQKFRMFMRPLQGNPDNITRVVLAACIIHNFIRINEDYKVPEVSDNTDTTPVEKSRLQDFPRR
ncbi:uncharacterized protein LOC126973478 [Leptidea sinapis]|uniref:uncharacterized protein LOC126973478 n=1 Tax=Leptidea sinapis TaxID=189913 RepID=UPI00213B4DB8|nr:uncharacterized protein LOC126973478 [Leptidea sinapis]